MALGTSCSSLIMKAVLKPPTRLFELVGHYQGVHPVDALQDMVSPPPGLMRFIRVCDGTQQDGGIRSHPRMSEPDMQSSREGDFLPVGGRGIRGNSFQT